MRCLKPVKKSRIVKGIVQWYEYRCMDCFACKAFKRNSWALRILLESMNHYNSVFITLTYDDDNCPLMFDSDDPSEHIRNFMKKLRKRIGKFRYFACGEYGEKSLRPHYHAVLFGVSLLNEQDIKNSWSYGEEVQVSDLTPARAAYVAKYTTKGVHQDPRIEALTPEFAVMSRRPGLASEIPEILVDTLINSNFCVIEDGELKEYRLPGAIRLQGRIWPLDRYIKAKIIDVFEKRGVKRISDFARFQVNHMKQVSKMFKQGLGDSILDLQINDKLGRKAKRNKGVI